ncbi:Aspartic proteinase nepenthesin-2 [Morus notabilis]|uniref:Aspartic proteinase nepenthesin-2 n=1 Tax=Morus notabilis TaxID=981085 RepID=W9RXM8_9ROSA|nr:probable aspartyl protease At4g16563 [Morus notabilis]EXC01923.1 Aspartic proteinase nepenthesin-2 [Morus notabilis]
MASSSSSSSSILFLISLSFLFFISPSSSAKITLSLSPFPHHSSDPLQTITSLASASLSRAHALKRPKSVNSSSSSSSTDSKYQTKTPLYPRSYGGYSVSLRFGTPPQILQFVMDTGSSLVWFPCTSRYLCSKCSFPNSQNPPKFIPKKSSSSKLIGCQNPKCQLVLGATAKCDDATAGENPKNKACPAYIIQYGSGSTIGQLLSETLNFPGKMVPDFIVGCSVLSIRQPSGIAGFGRGKESLPSQLRLAKFSYCLVSHRFDDTSFSSDLVLYSSSSDDKQPEGSISYTPFQKNPSLSSIPALKEYYYILIRKVIVGKTHVKIPYRYLVPGSDGHGGTIVDSGTTFTYMEKPVFDAVSSEFAKQMANYTRAKGIENRTGLGPCFDISKEKSVNFPELVLQFKGGAKMNLPLTNYFSIVGSPGSVCLTVVTNDDVGGPESVGGPAIILGNYQQQNFHIEYDLKNERFGFRRQICK